MEKEKKIRAAITGIFYYLKEEQERKPVTVKGEVTNQPSNWAFHSRQMTMINRDRFQRRVVKR